MTEAEWLTATDPTPMLAFLRGRVSNRKLRLIACGCCRRIWTLLVDERSRAGIEVVERYVDGRATQQELSAAQEAATRAADLPSWRHIRGMYTDEHRLGFAAAAVQRATRPTEKPDALAEAMKQAIHFSWSAESIGQVRSRVQETSTFQCQIIRCATGNPFRPVTVDPRWRSETAVDLATGIYAERAFDRMPILADALEEAGCDNADVLAHCRGDGPHVRGCWVVDLLLGKS